MDVEFDGFSTLNESGALSVIDEVTKMAIQETGTISTNTSVGNVVYDSASGNGVLINNSPNLKTFQTAPTEQNTAFSSKLEESNILNQITNKIAKANDSTKLTVVLRPNDLGRLSIELTSNKDGLTTNILAQNEDVRNYIEKNINNLRQQLSDAGVNVNNIQIKTAGQEGSTKYDGEFNQNQQQENNQNLNQQNKNNSQNNENKNKQEFYQTFTNNTGYEFNFTKDFSSILNKTMSYNLN